MWEIVVESVPSAGRASAGVVVVAVAADALTEPPSASGQALDDGRVRCWAHESKKKLDEYVTLSPEQNSRRN